MTRFEDGRFISVIRSSKEKHTSIGAIANDTKAKLNAKVMHTLLFSLNEDIFKQVSTCKSTKDIWEKLEKLYGNKKEEKKDGV
ncbi:hypothetical protein GQ457_16G022050 [Hibiscus cannabinus]